MPERKHPRLTEYDYSSNGAYFITICTQNREQCLAIVGQGLAPAEPPEIHFKTAGRIAAEQIPLLMNCFPCLHISNFVIMPNHIHLLLMLEENTAGASPRPTVSEIIGAYKSLVTRQYNMVCGRKGQKLFQTSFHDHIIRDEADYQKHWQYIDTNPARWAEDE